MNVLRHDDVAEDFEFVTGASGFQSFNEEGAGGGGVEVRVSIVAAEG
jgi:hypothetical protein